MEHKRYSYKVSLSLFFFAFVAAGSLYFSHLTMRTRYYQAQLEALAKGRTPAAIGKELDLSGLDGAALITASQKRLLSSARVILQDGEVGIELGHFATRDVSGGTQLACEVYNKVWLRFEGEGVSEFSSQPGDDEDGQGSYRPPVMEIEAPCRTAEDITRIEPIWVPIDKILRMPSADQDVSFEGDVKFTFKRMPTEWPPHWVLQSARLFNDLDPGRAIYISRDEVREIRGKKPLELNLK